MCPGVSRRRRAPVWLTVQALSTKQSHVTRGGGAQAGSQTSRACSPYNSQVFADAVCHCNDGLMAAVVVAQGVGCSTAGVHFQELFLQRDGLRPTEVVYGLQCAHNQQACELCWKLLHDVADSIAEPPPAGFPQQHDCVLVLHSFTDSMFPV